MSYIRCVIALSFLIITLSGCGSVEIPESSENTIVISDPADLREASSEDDDLTVASDEEEDESIPLTSCEEEKENLSEALQINTEALTTCETERKKLAAQIQNISQGTGETDRYQKFVSFYLENATMAEYPFPKCGAVSNFTGESWFQDFKSALEAKQISFGNKIVETSDLTGGCASPEGNMAFFLGAENETLSEFHLLKYDIPSNTVEEAFLVDGTCTICPNRLGKREGKYLTVFGEEAGTRVEYEYYYGSNILKQR